MAAVDDIEQEFFHHEVTIHRGAGASPYGMTTGDPMPVKGFVRQTTSHITGLNGDEIVTDTSVYVPLRILVEVGDTITLPAPFEGTWVVTNRAVFDGAGLDLPAHQKLTLTAEKTENVGGVYG